LIWLWFGFRLLRQVDFQHALVMVGGLLAAMRAVYGVALIAMAKRPAPL